MQIFKSNDNISMKNYKRNISFLIYGLCAHRNTVEKLLFYIILPSMLIDKQI